MNVIIAGSRAILDDHSRKDAARHVARAIEQSQFDIDTVVSGTAGGVDELGERWAEFQREFHNHDVTVDRHPAEWDNTDHPDAVVVERNDGSTYNKAAGPIRNREMAETADALVLVWNGDSNGSRSMLKLAQEHDLDIYEYRYDQHTLD